MPVANRRLRDYSSFVVTRSARLDIGGRDADHLGMPRITQRRRALALVACVLALLAFPAIALAVGPVNLPAPSAPNPAQSLPAPVQNPVPSGVQDTAHNTGNTVNANA